MMRNSETLRKASDHLYYEIWMFHSLVAGLASGVAGEGPICNAMVESFAIHTRNLADFFYPKRTRPDDVVAAHYFDSSDTWEKLCPPASEVLSAARKKADKEIAHLTYTRQKVTPEKKPWRFVELSQQIQPAIDAFCRSVPKELLGERWNQDQHEA